MACLDWASSVLATLQVVGVVVAAAAVVVVVVGAVVRVDVGVAGLLAAMAVAEKAVAVAISMIL